MERLTTNNPKNNLQTALNLFYVKDGQAWVRGGGPEPDYKDCSLYDYIRASMAGVLDHVYVQLTDEEIGSIMPDWLMDGHCCIPGLIAHLYTAAWAFAEIHHRLSKYEDTGLTPEEIASLQNSYQQLQEINDRTYRSNMAMGEDLKAIKAERDAALADLSEVRPCILCAYRHDQNVCRTCKGESWKWRGAKDKNVPTEKEV